MTELEKLLTRVRVLDYSEAILSVLGTLSVVIVVLSIYHLVMSIVCSLPNFTISSVAFAVIQVLVGLPFARLLQYMGLRIRRRLRLWQSTDESCCKKVVVITVNREDVERLFERYRSVIDNVSSGRPDDPSDVAWFVIVTFAVVSGIGAALQGGFQYVYSIPFVVVVLVGIYTTIVGYQSGGLCFDEIINTLEYDILQRLSALENAAGEKYESTMRWCEVRGSAFVDEIALTVNVPYDGHPDIIVKYRMRMPRTDLEEFQVDGQLSESIRQQLCDIKLTRIHGWSVTHNEDHVVIHRPTQFTTSFRDTIDADPQSIQEHATVLGEALSSIISILHKSIQ